MADKYKYFIIKYLYICQKFLEEERVEGLV